MERKLQVHGRRSNNFLKQFFSVHDTNHFGFGGLPSAITILDTRIVKRTLRTLK